MVNLKEHLTTKRLYSTFLHLALIVLAVQVVMLTIQNRKLKQVQSASIADQIKIGDTLTLRQLAVVDPRKMLDTTSGKQLVFIMTTSCPFCKQTLPIWNELAARVTHSISVIGISLDSRDSTLAYMKSNDISFPLAISLDVGKFKKMNKITGAPITLIRESGGKVLQLWIGKLDKQKALEVEASTSIDPVGHNQHKQGGAI
jgi:thiol-disulfide isomerase/thioredoxin